MTFCPGNKWTLVTKVSNWARTVAGAMGSTLPLLLMEATMFRRTGVVADIFATGCRPLIRTSRKATIPANSRNTTTLFRSFLSIST